MRNLVALFLVSLVPSWAHAIPPTSGCYLLFDVARPVERARDLLPFIHRLPGDEDS